MVELFQLQPSERSELERFLLQSPVENLFLLGVLEEHGLLPGFFGARENGSLRAVLLVAGGRSAVPYVPDAQSFQGWNTLAAMVRGGGRLVGAADSVGPLWHALRRRLGDPRPVLDRPQFLYRLDREALKPAPRTALRLARPGEIDAVVAAHARMIAEDEGYDPQDMGRERFRRAVAGRIERQTVWIVADDHGVQFKVDLSADCRLGAQFAGVYTAPAHRRKGIARDSLADLATRVVERRPRVTLHVDSKNTPAIRTYESVGFVRDMDFRMVVLGY